MPRPVAVGVGLALVAAALLDLVAADGTAAARTSLPVSLALAAAALMVSARRRRLSPRGLRRAGAGLAAGSALLTTVALLPGRDGPYAIWGLLEAAGFLFVLGTLSRRRMSSGDTLVLVAVGAALVAAPWRLDSADAVTFSLLAALVAAAALAVGSSRRADDLRAVDDLVRVRNAERRDIARDLHDDVAHHVTGILVTAQAATVVAGDDPDAARRALVAIERTATDALEAMRSVVSVLRDPGQEPGRDARRWSQDLRDLLEAFGTTTGTQTTLTFHGAPIPVAYRQAVHRVTQEALTNVRRHAAGASRADVVVTRQAGAVRVTVTDDGRSGGARTDALSGSGGGFGLVGLRERAAAFGGTLTAGPTGERGWRVDAVLPLPDTASGQDTP